MIIKKKLFGLLCIILLLVSKKKLIKIHLQSGKIKGLKILNYGITTIVGCIMDIDYLLSFKKKITYRFTVY